MFFYVFHLLWHVVTGRTHTHTHTKPADKAIAVPFTEFMGGMQNDGAMPTEDFNPVWVAFIWPAVPFEFAQTDDALTRAELLIQSEQDNIGEDSEILKTAQAAKVAMENEDPDDEELKDRMKTLMQDTFDDEEDDEDDANLAAYKAGDADAVIENAKNNPVGNVIEDVLSVFRPIVRPVENLVFGRLMKRGRRAGIVMAEVLGKIMEACEGRPKVCLMANSLGAHVLVGSLSASSKMPYKVHTVFFVQGAISREWFKEGHRYSGLSANVAGPFLCTYSDCDYMLKNVFGPFHGDAIGFDGFGQGEVIDMKGMDELGETPYEFELDRCLSVNGSAFINEGNAVAGGHGDFKEDETTSLYWSMINTEVEDERYEH